MTSTKFQLLQLDPQSTVIEKLTVLSYEMNVYLVELHISNTTGLVFDGTSPKRFHSAQQIRDIFELFVINSAEMRHDSPYDEMIGNPDSAQYLGTLPFSMQQPY